MTALLFFCALAGCSSTGQLPAKAELGDRRVGKVYVFRGFLGFWSTGMDGVVEKLNRQGISAEIYRNDQWGNVADQIIREREGKPDPEPLVLIGHSYGADNALRVARTLREHNISVDLVVTLEGAIPPAVPANVGYAMNIYKPRPLDFLPWWRGVPVENAAGRSGILEQVVIPRDWPDVDRFDLGHSDVDDDPKIQDRIVARVLPFCPTFPQWAAAHSAAGAPGAGPATQAWGRP